MDLNAKIDAQKQEMNAIKVQLDQEQQSRDMRNRELASHQVSERSVCSRNLMVIDHVIPL